MICLLQGVLELAIGMMLFMEYQGPGPGETTAEPQVQPFQIEGFNLLCALRNDKSMVCECYGGSTGHACAILCSRV